LVMQLLSPCGFVLLSLVVLFLQLFYEKRISFFAYTYRFSFSLSKIL
jgi:hypothetical protein